MNPLSILIRVGSFLLGGGDPITSENEENLAKELEEIRRNATNKPTKGKQYSGGKPVLTKPPSAPSDPDDDAIAVTVDYKLPLEPNKAAVFDPFTPPVVRLKEFIRAISGGSATKQDFGSLELWPQVFTPATFNYTADIIGTGRRQAHLEEGAKKFMAWFSRSLEDDQINNPYRVEANYWDQAALISPEVPGDFCSPINMIFGQQAIWDEIADTVASGTNAYIGGLRGLVYMEEVTLTVRPSGETDLSDRIPAAGFEFFENVAHGETQRALGVGDSVYLPNSLIEHTKEEQLAILKKTREELTSNHTGMNPDDYEMQLNALEKEMSDVSTGISYKKVIGLQNLLVASTQLITEVLGAYPIKILIEKGAFLNKRVVNNNGKSKVEDLPEQAFNLPNIAETLAELASTSIRTSSALDLHSEMLQRLCAEVCSVKSSVIDTYDLADLIVDFFGMPIDHINQKYPLLFDPFIATDDSFENIYQILLGKEIEYKKPVFKMTKESQTLSVQLGYLLKGAQIIHGAFYKEYRQGDGGIKYDLEALKKAAKFAEGVKGMTEGEGNPSKISLDEWLKMMVEQGASDYTGEEDSKTPWDVPWDERPQAWVRQTKDALTPNKIYGSLGG